MKIRCLLPCLLLTCALLAPAAVTAAPSGRSSKLDQLSVSVGRWIYHGRFPATAKSPATAWTWHEECRWSSEHLFMLCSFSNTWGRKHVQSLVVDTYNTRDQAFWHYEIFKDGTSPNKPFATKMQINGTTRIESWTQTKAGEKVHERIVYKYSSGKKVSVAFQQSRNGTQWSTTAKGTGKKVQ